MSTVGRLLNPRNPNVESVLIDMRNAARTLGLQLLILNAGKEEEIDAAFASMPQKEGAALVVGNDPFFFSRRQQLVRLAARDRLPVIYPWHEFAASGGLISYGPTQATFYRPVGIYVGRILKGEKPADLPVQQPTTFELVVNLKTAEELGLTVPASILARTDEVIE